MYAGATVGVVVPAYNEEGLVGRVIESIPEYVDRVYVVDDRSSDGTWEEIRRSAAAANAPAPAPAPESDDECPERVAEADGGLGCEGRVVPVRHETNRGVGGAIMTGYGIALREGIDVVAVMNGDGQMDPAILDRFVEPVATGAADYAKGDRLRYPEFREGMSRWRLFGNALLTGLTRVASGYWGMTDSQNGYTAISREALEAIGPTNFYSRYGFLNDALVKLNAHEFSIVDIPMRAVYGDETSGIAYRSFVPGLSLLLLRGFCWRLKTRYLVDEFHPLAVCYLLGVSVLLAGVALAGIGVAGIAGVEALGVPGRSGAVDGSMTGETGTLVAGLGLAAVGALSCLVGALLDARESAALEVTRA